MSAATAHQDIKLWIDVAVKARIDVGPIHWPDGDSWVKVNGVLHEIPAGKRAEITPPDTVTIKELVR